MTRRRRGSNKAATPKTQEDSMAEYATEYDNTQTEYDGTEPEILHAPEDVDVDVDATDDETEEVAVNTDSDGGDQDKPAKAKKEKPAPKRGQLPDGLVTPIGLAKVISERGLYTTREGEVAELKPQMVYSYIKNAPSDNPYPGKTVEDSIGALRENVVEVEEGVAWWERKNARAAERAANAAAKAREAAEKAAKKAAASTTEAEVVEDNSPAEEAE